MPPPVSARIVADVAGDGSGLVLFRMGDHNAWVRWFAEAVSGAGRAQQELVPSVERLQRPVACSIIYLATSCSPVRSWRASSPSP
jgi:hypothetical protein